MRKLSVVAPGWWDYTTLDDKIAQDAARLTVADIGIDRDGLGQNLPIGRGQPFTEGQLIAFAMLHPLHAKLPPPAGLHGQTRFGQLHERRVIQPRFDQIFRQVHADARAGAVRLHVVVHHPETVFCCRAFQRSRRIVSGL